jgi:hypothetical protein
MIYLDGLAYDDRPMSRDVCALWQLLSDVPRAKAPIFTPVGVPVRAMRTAGTAVLSALDRLEPVGDFRLLGGAFGIEAGAVPMKEQPTDEDHQAPKVVLVEPPDGTDEIAFDRHEQPFPAAFLGS